MNYCFINSELYPVMLSVISLMLQVLFFLLYKECDIFWRNLWSLYKKCNVKMCCNFSPTRE